ncbi:hypothetical protein D3C85_1351850 [compost metagenome]
MPLRRHSQVAGKDTLIFLPDRDPLTHDSPARISNRIKKPASVKRVKGDETSTTCTRSPIDIRSLRTFPIATPVWAR